MLKLIFTNEIASPHEASLFTPLIQKTEALVEGISEEEVEFSLVGDEAIHAINLQTRGFDKPTDVLSFATREIEWPEGVPTPPDQGKSLGQIVISVPAAQRNADQMGQSLEEELRFLFVHGLLHILGYDHQTTPEETEMMTLAYQILGRPPYQPD